MGLTPDARQQAPHFPLRILDLGYREAGSDYAVDLHEHGVHQLYLVLGGEVCMCLPEHDDILLGTGEAVLVPPGVTRGPVRQAGSPSYLVLIFENRGLQLDGILLKRLRLSAQFDADVSALIAELRRPGRINPAMLRYALVTRLLIGLCREAGSSELPSRLNAASRHAVVEQVDAFIRAHVDHPLDCAGIAVAVHVSAPQLNRILRAQVGMSIGGRLLHWRLEQAKMLLRSSSMSITQVAGAAGFDSLSWFSKIFAREVGVVPSDYRKSGARWNLKA